MEATISLRELAAKLDLSPETVRNWATKGKLLNNGKTVVLYTQEGTRGRETTEAWHEEFKRAIAKHGVKRLPRGGARKQKRKGKT